MMFFGKKKTRTEPPKGEPRSGSNAGGDLARDAIAAVIRTLAQYALPTTAVPADEFSKRCEELATAALVQNAVDERTGRPVRPEKIYAEIKQNVRNQRRAESAEYSKHRESAHILVSDLVTSLKRSLEQRQGHDKEIVNLLAEMEEVVNQGDLQAIRRVSGRTAKHIRHVIGIQRERDQQQLESLSNQLRSMREELQEVQQQMQRDPLTELLNRGAFEEAFEKTVDLAHASATDLTLFMLDLDYFKKVNDAYGHQAGDKVLKVVSRQLIRCFPRKDDMVVRYGGEEFAVICRNTGIEDAYNLGERVRMAVERLEIDLEDLNYHQTISVGYAVLEPSESPQRFLKRADTALFDAKRAGRNCVAPVEA